MCGVLELRECPVTAELKQCLTLSRTTNFRLFQNERVCRQQFQIA